MAWYNADLSSGGTEAEKIAFDNNISGLNSDNVQGAIDDVVRTIGYVKSKNLLVVPYIDFNKTENGVTWVINSDYTVMGTGTSTVAEAEFLCTQRQHQPLTLKAGTYILSGSPKGGSDSSYYMKIGKTASNGNYELMGKDYGDGFIFTLTEETKLSVTCDLVQGYKATDITFYPMVRYASIEDDTYEPYVADVQTQLNTIFTSVDYIIQTTSNSSASPYTRYGEVDISSHINAYGTPISINASNSSGIPVPCSFSTGSKRIKVCSNLGEIYTKVVYVKIPFTVK